MGESKEPHPKAPIGALLIIEIDLNLQKHMYKEISYCPDVASKTIEEGIIKLSARTREKKKNKNGYVLYSLSCPEPHPQFLSYPRQKPQRNYLRMISGTKKKEKEKSVGNPQNTSTICKGSFTVNPAYFYLVHKETRSQ